MTYGESALQIRLFGRPRLHYRGHPIPLKLSAGSLSLLVYLLLHREEPHSRAALASALCPDASDEHARATLRDHIRNVRAALPSDTDDPWLVTNRSTAQWNPRAPVWLDIAAFEQRTDICEAVAIYTGEFALGLDAEWMPVYREAFHVRQTQLLVACMNDARARGEHDRALAYARDLLAHDAWCEEAVRAQIELLNAVGERTGALKAYRDFAQRLKAELDVPPAPETVAVYERILGHIDRERHNLPAPMTTFVGRESERERLRTTIAERRLVTLTGPGGVGKTRLAIEAARDHIDRLADGAWIVELAQSFDAASLVSVLANVLRLQSTSEDSLFAMLRHKQLLLVLDNCEHLIDAVAAIVNRLLGNCPNVHILATSREPLRISGERVEHIDVLPLAPAMQLLRDRLADVSPASVLPEDASTRDALATISEKLDGIPLAIELAAACASSLGLAALAQRLDDRFALLTAGKRSALPHQQTLRATLDWSFELLGPDEQLMLVRLGAFSGGWTLAAATIVCGYAPLLLGQAPALLSALVDKSLVRVDMRRSEPRYQLLETTRAYVNERASTADATGIAQRQAGYFHALAERHDATWVGGFTGASAEILTAELENFRSVLSWSIEGGNDRALGTALVCNLRWFFAFRALNAEGVRWCELALAALGPRAEPEQEGTVQLALAGSMGAAPFFPRFHFFRAHQPERYVEAALRSADLLRGSHQCRERALAFALAALHLRLADRHAEAAATADEAIATASTSESAVALSMALYAKSYSIDEKETMVRRGLLQRALDVVGPIHGPYNRATTLHALGEVAFQAGNRVEALAYAQDAVRSYAGFESPFNLAQVNINVAAYALALDRNEIAGNAARDALTVAHRVGDPMIAAAALQHLAGIAVSAGDPKRAAQLLGASDAHRGNGPPRLFTEHSGYHRTKRALTARLPDRALERLLREGREWSADHAVQRAFEYQS